MAKQSSKLSELINRLPDPDERGLLSNIDKKTVDNVIAQIYEGGRRSLVALISMLVEPGHWLRNLAATGPKPFRNISSSSCR